MFKPKSISGNLLFRNYANYMNLMSIKYKEKYGNKSKILKSLTSGLHGILTDTFTKTKRIDLRKTRKLIEETDTACFYDIDYEVENNETLFNPNYRNKKVVLETLNTNRIYTSNLARLKPFVYSLQRSIIFDKVLSKYGDNIVRFNTDGFITTKSIKEFEKNSGYIGEFRFEGSYDMVLIRHINSIKKETEDNIIFIGKAF
jgi:hypothetical protein